MNTKQLYNALTLNAYTNKYFDGIYSIDTLKDINEKPELIICNTDPSDKPGKHWVLFFFNDDESVDFYDSLGKDIKYYGSEFSDFVNKFAKSWYSCVERTQPLGTSLCGQYCLYYAYGKTQSCTMREIIDSMFSPELVVNFVNKKFYIHSRYNSIFLQNCVKC